jgi:protocatechuate 3,4-dioxygenase, beta subunit
MSGAYGPKAFDDHPPFRFEAYRSTAKRAPDHTSIRIPAGLSELTGPGVHYAINAEPLADLTRHPDTGEMTVGERIIVVGRVLDDAGLPVPNTLVEIWQANAAGRYRHERDGGSSAPLDPNFVGAGRCITGDDGSYRFLTVRPGAYPWGNHHNAWRPSHIHFSLLGSGLGSRLVTQMYFPGDPLQPLDPIFNAVPEQARGRLVAAYDHDVTEPNWALGFRWDIVIRGPRATPEDAEAHA